MYKKVPFVKRLIFVCWQSANIKILSSQVRRRENLILLLSTKFTCGLWAAKNNILSADVISFGEIAHF